MQNQILLNAWANSLYGCVGLDTDPLKIPKFLIEEHGGNQFSAMLEFNQKIIDKTADLVIGYKINVAFYEQYGSDGMFVFNETIAYLNEQYSSFNIADAKRGDIGNTNNGYTYFLEDFDAMTISPWFGKDANEPFFSEKYTNRIIIVLAKTSNPGSADFQDKVSEGLPMYLHVIKQAKEWGNVAFVVGGTHPDHLLRARYEAGENGIILVPGIGVQDGNLQKTIQYGPNSKNGGLIINMSRSVIYASNEENYAEAARSEMLKFNAETKDTIEYNGKIYKPLSKDPRTPHELTIKFLGQSLTYPSTLFVTNNFEYNLLTQGYYDETKIQPLLVFMIENVWRTGIFDEFNLNFTRTFTDTNFKKAPLKLYQIADLEKLQKIKPKKVLINITSNF